MPATNPTLSHPFSTKFHYSADGGDNYSELADVVAVTANSFERGSGDGTTLSATSMVRRKVPGWIEPGTYTFRLMYKDATYTILKGIALRTSLQSQYTWKITFPVLPPDVNGATLVGNGFITRLGITEGSTDSDDLYECDCEVQIDGTTTFTEGS